MTMLDAIGHTRLVPLRHMVPEGSARVLVKLEYESPTGSMQDRMALAMIEAAEADGRLRPGGSVVEYTGGSTARARSFFLRPSKSTHSCERFLEERSRPSITFASVWRDVMMRRWPVRS